MNLVTVLRKSWCFDSTYLRQPRCKQLPSTVAIASIMSVTLDDLPFLVKALDEVHYKWRMFGTALELPQRKLHDIEVQGPKIDLSSFMREALEAWLKMTDIEHTWWCVCEAVEDNDNKRLANRLRDRYKTELKAELPKDDSGLLNRMLADLDEMIPQWSTFCLYLGVKKPQLNKIEMQVTTKIRMQNMLESWITEKDELATIEAILNALESPLIENNALAKRLRENKKVKDIMNRKAPPTTGSTASAS